MTSGSLVATAALILFSLLPSPAEADGPYAYEEFEDGVEGIFNTLYGLDTSPSGHAGRGIYTEFQKGDVWGARSFWNFSQHGYTPPTELYWRYWVKFDADFYITPPLRGKLPGPATLGTDGCNGGDPSTIANPCFSARTMFSRDYRGDALDGETLLGYYNYSLDSPSHRGDLFDWDPNVALLDFGQWYCVEGHIDLGSPGGTDGVLRAWVDGSLAFDDQSISYRRATEDFGIESFWFDVYYGNPSQPSPRTQGISMDSWAIGASRQGCNDAVVWQGTFRDDDNSIFQSDIEWIADQGITHGCNPPTNDRFCPEGTVSRGEMAAFLDRALSLPPTTKDWFEDDNGSTFEASVNRLAEAGITQGCMGGSSFCADQPVSRGQMAAFLRRALDGTLPSVTYPGFIDTSESVFEMDILWLAEERITQGCNPPLNSLFCPTNKVTRGQMAAFLRRALDV